MPFFIPPRSLRIPRAELGPARGLLPFRLRPSAGGVGNPPAGFVPGLPAGLTGIPENEYWHHPLTGEIWTRPRLNVLGPTQVRIGVPGTSAGRRVQKEVFERETRAPAPELAGPRPQVSLGTRSFLIGLGNVAGNLVNNVVRAVVIAAAGPAAPLVAPAILPLIPRIPMFALPITTPIAQPQATDIGLTARETVAGRDPATFEQRLEASRGGVTEVQDGIARGVVETVQGTRTFEFDVPFPEVGF